MTLSPDAVYTRGTETAHALHGRPIIPAQFNRKVLPAPRTDGLTQLGTRKELAIGDNTEATIGPLSR